MAFLNRIEPVDVPAPQGEVQTPARVEIHRSLRLTIDLGRTAAIVVVAGLVIAAAVVLYAMGDNAAGRLFVDIFVGVVSGGLGLNVGERGGAKEAEDKLVG